MILYRKFGSGGIYTDKGDPYEYKVDASGTYTRKKGSGHWIKLNDAIASKVKSKFGIPAQKSKPVKSSKSQEEESDSTWYNPMSWFSEEEEEGEGSETRNKKSEEDKEREEELWLEAQRKKYSVTPEASNFWKHPITTTAGAVSNVIPAFVRGMGKFIGDSYLKGVGILDENKYESYVSNSDFSPWDLKRLASAVKHNLNTAKNGVLHYVDYYWDDPRYKGLPRNQKTKDLINKQNAKHFAYDSRADVANTIGGANVFIDDDGNIIVADMYDFNSAIKRGKNPSLTPGRTLDIIENTVIPRYKRKQERGEDVTAWGTVSDFFSQVGNTMPTFVNLGKAEDFLTPEEIKYLKRFPGKEKYVEDYVKKEARHLAANKKPSTKQGEQDEEESSSLLKYIMPGNSYVSETKPQVSKNTILYAKNKGRT